MSVSDFYGFTIHGQIIADSKQEAEDSGNPLVDALLALDFVSGAEVWISLEPDVGEEPTPDD